MTQSAAAIPLPQTLRQPVSQIRYACRITESSVLCCGPLRHVLTGKENIVIDGLPAEKPYLAARLGTDSPGLVALALTVDQDYTLDTIHEVTFSHPHGTSSWKTAQPLDEKAEGFEPFINSLSPTDRAKILFLLIKLSGHTTAIGQDPSFLRLCTQARTLLQPSEAPIQEAHWLTENGYYLEAQLPRRDYSKARLIITEAIGVRIALAEIMELSRDAGAADMARYGILILFKTGGTEDCRGRPLSLMLKDQLIPLQPISCHSEPGAASILAHLARMPERLRFSLRDFLIRNLIEHSPRENRASASDLIRTLQYFLPLQQTSVCDKQSPFGINTELVIPMADQGVFLSGWIFDPQRLLKEVWLITDLGFRIPVSLPHTLPRPDVSALYEDSPFSSSENEWGFVTLAAYPEDVRKKLKGWPMPFSFRLSVTLKGRLNYVIAPEAARFDARSLKHQLLERAAPYARKNSAAIALVRDIASRLQSQAMKEVTVSTRRAFGTPVKKPDISVIIPLTRSLEFIPAQVAHFANDPFMRKTEIIYVLDSPALQEKAENQLRDLHALYGLPVTVFTLSHSAGFALAANLGAAQARAPHWLFMKENVLPLYYGWLEDLADYLRINSDVGAVAPKLLYEDDSIQHAGQFFELDAQGHYETKGYFKGYPANHPPACISRAVPAISSACMLVSAALFARAGQLSSDYAAGNYEDSDFSLKTHALENPPHYCAEVSLYHFEQKPHAPADTIGEALHHARWKDKIAEVMKHYG